MPLPYRITGAYEQLVQQFQETAENANAGTVRSCSFSDTYYDKGIGVRMNQCQCYLYLKGWKWRPGKTPDVVDILVHADTRIEDKYYEMVKSTVCVSYFTVENNCAKPLHSIHFDFNGHQENHPVFHAQLTAKAIVVPEPKVKEIRFDCQVDTNEVRCFKNARIPTSDMTLSSVLLCLAADHMQAKFVREYMDSLRRIEAKLPAPKCDALRSSLANESEHVRSRHWFAHMEAS